MRKQITGNGSQNFVITVRSQENHTWQGTVSWVEGKKQENFRSVLELLKLLDSAVEGKDLKNEFPDGNEGVA